MTINPTKGDITKPMPVKWIQLAEMIVLEGMSFLEAGKTLYKESYIKSNAYQAIAQDKRFCGHIDALRNKQRERSQITVDTIQDNARIALESCIECTGDVVTIKPREKAAYLKANEQLGKTIGAFVEKKVNYNIDMAQMLTQAAQSRESNLTEALMPKRVKAAVIDAQDEKGTK